jgi:hypothetical protein
MDPASGRSCQRPNGGFKVRAVMRSAPSRRSKDAAEHALTYGRRVAMHASIYTPDVTERLCRTRKPFLLSRERLNHIEGTTKCITDDAIRTCCVQAEREKHGLGRRGAVASVRGFTRQPAGLPQIPRLPTFAMPTQDLARTAEVA